MNSTPKAPALLAKQSLSHRIDPIEASRRAAEYATEEVHLRYLRQTPAARELFESLYVRRYLEYTKQLPTIVLTQEILWRYYSQSQLEAIQQRPGGWVPVKLPQEKSWAEGCLAFLQKVLPFSLACSL